MQHESVSSQQPAHLPTAAAQSTADTAAQAQHTVSYTKPIDRYAHLPTLSEERIPADATAPRYVRYRLLSDPQFKYPLIRVQEEWTQVGNVPQLMKQTAMVGDHLMVTVKSPQAGEQLLAALSELKPRIRKQMPASGIWLVAFDEAEVSTLRKALELIRTKGQHLVKTAEPDYLAHALLTPKDSNFTDLWGMDNTGQSGGTADVDVDAPAAWELSTGSRLVKVGVIDSGTSLTHADLAANIWTNAQEIASNGLDDDGNGYVDDLHGWDFYNGDANPDDDHGHGTHTSGTVGAVGNNALGVAGICWQVSLIPLKFLGANGSGVTSDAIDAIYYASAQGVIATNNSWGGDGYSQLMRDAIEHANTQGSLFVAASGNEAVNLETSPTYPANYTNANMITVGAVTRQGGMAWFSNYGPQFVSIAAPGTEVTSTTLGSSYGAMNGTSMATPHVTGAAALLKAYRPSLTAAEIRTHLLANTKPLASLTGKVSSGGMLDVDAALAAVNDLAVTPVDAFTSTGPRAGPFTPSQRSYTVSNASSTPISWTVVSSQPWVSLSPASGTLAAGAAVSIHASINTAATALPVGLQTADITVLNTGSGRSQTRRVRLTIERAPLVSYPLDTDPGWTRDGAWAYGQPLGAGGIYFGFPDPTAGATGVNVFGTNLNGDYTEVGGPYHVTTAAIDLSQYESAQLRYQRWLNIDFQPWASATVEVSTDGTSWTPIWDNGSAEIADSSWSPQTLDLGALTDGQSTVYVRWGYVLNNGAYIYSGWNIDDIQLLANPKQRLNLTLAAMEVTEAGSVTGTLQVTPAATEELIVTLTMSNNQASAPATLTVPVGSSSVPFTLTAVDDALLDGSQSCEVVASLSGYTSGRAELTVHDNESTTLTVTLPTSLTEGGSTGIGVVLLATAAEATISVKLASSDVGELSAPAEVTVPVGQTTASFTLTPPQDTEIDGTQNVSLTASVTGWGSSSTNLDVLDDEQRSITLDLPAGTAETASPLVDAGHVSLPGTLPTALIIDLQSSTPTALTVPASVTIPAGHTTASFTLTPVNDPTLTGHQEVTLSAVATTWTAGTATLRVYDAQTLSTPVQPSPAHLATAESPEADLSWLLPPGTGANPTSYDLYFGNTSTLTETERIATDITTLSHALPRLTRGATYYWRVVAKLGAVEQSSATWQFTVAPLGPVASFVWAPVASPELAGLPFPITLTAKDAYSDTVTDFTGQAQLASFTGDAEVNITELGIGLTDGVELTNVSYRSVDVSGWQLVIYDDLSWPLPKLTFTLPANTTLAAGQRLTLSEDGIAPGSFPNFSMGQSIFWTEVGRVATMLRTASGDVVDFVTVKGEASQITQPLPVPANHWQGGPISVSGNVNLNYLRAISQDYNVAAEWVAAAPSFGLVNGQLTLPFLTAGPELTLTPALTGNFSAGTWTGSVAIAESHPGVQLVAYTESSPGVYEYGLSNVILVNSAGALQATAAATPLREGDGSVAGFITVTLPVAPPQEVTLTLTSSDSSELTGSSLTLAAGSTSAVLPVSILDDAEVDGPQPVTLTLSAPGYLSATVSTTVHDNEDGGLTLAALPTTSESAGSITGTVSLAQPAAVPISVNLSSSDESEATVPAAVLIPVGESSASFAITVQEDDVIDGDQTATLTATVPYWTSSSQPLTITDNELRVITLSVLSSLNESTGSSSTALRLDLSGRVQTALTVDLSSSSSSQLSLPASILVPAMQSQVFIPISPTDDALLDGTATVSITASAATFTPDTKDVLISDNDVHHFTASTIPSPQVEGVGIPWQVIAYDVNDQPLQQVAGPVLLGSQPGLTLLPSIAGPFDSAGSWSGSIRAMSAASGARLSITAPSGATLESNLFDINAGPHLQISPATVAVTVVQNQTTTADITLSNTGATAAAWSLPSSPASWVSASPSSGSIPVGGTQTVTLTFQATAQTVGTKTATLNLTSNDAVRSPHALPLSMEVQTGFHHLRFTSMASSYVTDTALPFTIEAVDVADTPLPWTGSITVALAKNSGDATATSVTLSSAPETGISTGSILPSKVSPDAWLTADAGAGITAESAHFSIIHGALAGFEWSNIGPQVAATFFPVTLRAIDAGGNTVLSHTRALRVTETSGRDASPLNTAGFTDGMWSGQMLVNAAVPSAVLRVTDSVAGVSSDSNAFSLSPRPVLNVTANTPNYAWGSTGGALTVDGPTISLLNLGYGPLHWTLSLDQPWLTASSASGTLADHGSSAIITLSGMVTGMTGDTATLTFTNTDNALGNTTRSVVLTVEPPGTTLEAEPAFTGGLSNTISWANVATASHYQVELTAGTGTPAVQAWQTGLSQTLSSLTSGVNYNYRVRAKLAGTGSSTQWMSEWSAPVTSTQDATAPNLAVDYPSPYFTTLPDFTVTGTSSDNLAGVNEVAVTAGYPVSTSDAFAHWSSPFTGLSHGTFGFTITARDNAVPPNTRTNTWTLSRIQNDAASVLSAALNSGSTTTSLGTADGKQYVQFTFPRRVGQSGFTYIVESSTDLVNWSSADVVPVSNTPQGSTELSTWRLTPAVEDGQLKFMRVRVTIDQ